MGIEGHEIKIVAVCVVLILIISMVALVGESNLGTNVCTLLLATAAIGALYMRYGLSGMYELRPKVAAAYNAVSQFEQNYNTSLDNA
jgi:hypothetical protein